MSAEAGRELATRAADPAPARKGCLATLVALAVAFLSGVYLLNLGAGVIELVPDNLPFVGHVDEFGASVALLASLRYLFVRSERGRGPQGGERGPVAPPGARG